MNDVSNIIINEICWIVQQRNEWAKRRQHYRNKFRYYRNMSEADQSDLNIKYKQINDERLKLKPYTKRLRGLLKKINGVLRSDKNAGYDSIEYTIGNSDICKIIWRGEIGARAKDYEVDLYLANMFKGA